MKNIFKFDQIITIYKICWSMENIFKFDQILQWNKIFYVNILQQIKWNINKNT